LQVVAFFVVKTVGIAVLPVQSKSLPRDFLFVCLLLLLFLARQLQVGQGLLIHEVSRSHTTTHHSR